MVFKEGEGEELPSTQLYDPEYASGDYTMVNNISPPSSSDDEQFYSAPARPRLISSCSWLMILLLTALLVYRVVASRHALVGIGFAALTFVPCIVIALLVLRAFRDGTVPNSFLLSQFFVGAVPLYALTILVQIVFGIVCLMPVLATIPAEMWEDIKNFINATKPAEEVVLFKKLLTGFSTKVPVWSIILSVTLVSYISCGYTKEVGKWLFVRRYRRYGRGGTEEHRIGSNAIFASACLVALGFAMTEAMGILVSLARLEISAMPVHIVLVSVLKGLLSFPAHIGTQMYVAVAAAHKYVFRDQTSVIWRLSHAIIFQGTFDAVTYTIVVLTVLGKVPTLITFAAPAINAFLVMMLWLLVRARYKGLQERERVAGIAPS